MKTICRTALTAACTALLVAACGGSGDDAGNTTAASSGAAAEGRATKLAALPANVPIPADAPTRGMYGPLQNWPLIPLHAVLTPDGRLLTYGSKGDGLQSGRFIYDVWDSDSGSHLTLANNSGTDLFCSSQIVLPGGTQVFIAGGDNWTGTATTNTGNNNSNIFSLADNSLTRAANMNRARWYSSQTALLNGETYIQGGSGGEDLPEIRSTAGAFRLMNGIGTGGLAWDYPRNFVAPDGRLFGFDTAGRMYWITTTGAGTITMAGQLPTANTGSDTSAAMFAPGRILQFGGNSKGAVVIDINGTAPAVTTTGSLTWQRRLGTATVLANGRVLASGGSSIYNDFTNVAYQSEIWNPQTGTWALAATGVRTRLYHSVAILLPDATVLVGGGGASGPAASDRGPEINTNAEIYYPPYLFNANATLATRPAITTAPTVVDVGRTVQVVATGARPVARVTFVKTGSVTHAWNMEQRFVDLPFVNNNGTLAVQIPARASDVTPGTWMMFVIDDAGVPSVAKMVRVNVAPALNTAITPVITAPGNQSGNVGTAVNLAIAATDPNGDALKFSASGLPAGLAIETATGRITGTPTTVGTSSVTVAASDGINSASTTFTWTVNPSTGGVTLAVPATPAPAAVGGAVAFIASATGSGVTYTWDFGDGTAVTAPSASGNASHVYTSAGVWYATVTATGSAGGQQSQTIMVQTYAPTTAAAPSISSAMALEVRANQNTRLWVVNPDSDTVSVFDTVTRTRVAEIDVETGPTSVAVAPNGTIWVVNKKAASIVVFNPTTLAVVTAIGLPQASRPHGIAMARGSTSALVALEATGQLAKINTGTYAITTLLDVGPNPRHVSVAADGSTAYVSRFVTRPLPAEGTAAPQTTLNSAPVGGEVVVVNAGTMAIQRTLVLAHGNKTDAENQGRGIPNYLGAAAISPDGTQAWVPSKQDNILRGATRDGQALNFQNTVRAVSSRLNLATQAEDLAARIDHDNASVASAAAYDPLGIFLFVALETSREVAVIDANRRNQLMRIDVGRAPQAVLVSADRRTLYVQNFMDRTVGMYDLSPLVQRSVASATPLATLGTTSLDQLGGAVLTGKQFFYDARDTRLARDRYMSCATCHNEGGHDGRVWDLRSQGEGLRNTPSLRGRGGMGHGALHWSNNFDEVQDFEGQIRTLAGGTGLMTDAQYNTGTRSQPLGDPKAGVSADLDALAAYVASLNTFEQSPWRPDVNVLSTPAAAGRTLFTSLNCASCHTGANFTRSAAANPADVGTLKPTSGLRLNGPLTGIDVPTLRDVWATAPYLHDGSAPTLEAAITAHTTLGVSAANATSLAAYLREIGRDEGPAPAPVVNGTGLVGNYYAGTALAGTPLLTRTEAVNFTWAGSPGGSVPADNFSVRWTGTVTAATSGSYRFRTLSDDGVRLWVDGVLRINNWTDHGTTTDTSGSFTLSAGKHTIVLEYFERTGGATMQFQWLRPGTFSYAVIPATSLNSP